MLVLMTFIVALADGYGLFVWLQSAVGPLIRLLHIPDRMLVPALTYLGNSTAAHYMVGALYKSGAVTWQTATVTVLVGTIMGLPFVFLKHSLARNISILGTRDGILNTFITLGIGMVGRMVFLAGFLMIAVL